MKKLSLFYLTLPLLFSLSACGAPTQPDTSPTLQHETTGATLTLEMPKETLENTLSSIGIDFVPAHMPTDPCIIWSAVYGSGEDQITVWYSGDTNLTKQLVVGHISDSNNSSHWYLDSSISLGSSKQDIKTSYGDSTVDSGSHLSYYYDINGNKPVGDVMTGFDLNETGQVEYFYIATLP
ncbi:MAG: hypothetical protein IKT45_01170 [Lachnospiraceae bacterium]|nr:hypothetical protein [Lachnospiraceae bacterium]